jgi:hypothetical protein
MKIPREYILFNCRGGDSWIIGVSIVDHAYAKGQSVLTAFFLCTKYKYSIPSVNVKTVFVPLFHLSKPTYMHVGNNNNLNRGDEPHSNDCF